MENELGRVLGGGPNLTINREPPSLDVEIPEGVDENWFHEYLSTRRSAVCEMPRNRAGTTIVNPLDPQKPPNNGGANSSS